MQDELLNLRVQEEHHYLQGAITAAVASHLGALDGAVLRSITKVADTCRPIIEARQRRNLAGIVGLTCSSSDASLSYDASPELGQIRVVPLPDAGDVSIEDAIQAKGLTAPRVTPAELEAEIASEHYFTAEEGTIGAYRANNDVYVGTTPNALNATALPLLTFCVLILRNGFTVHGTSACASPENFDAEIGRRIARENAVREIWPLLGFRLRDSLIPAPTTGDC